MYHLHVYARRTERDIGAAWRAGHQTGRSWRVRSNNELLVKIMNDPKQRSDFLDICYRFDSNPFVCGMGKDNLLAKGEINHRDSENGRRFP